MAQSRLEKIGTIFTRVTGLLKSDAMKIEDKPLWYDVYSTFPPKLEPKFDRSVPSLIAPKIFYEEDILRARFQKNVKNYETVNLIDLDSMTQCHQFFEIYYGLKSEGALDDEKIFLTAKSMLSEKVKTRSRQNEYKNLDGYLLENKE